jgi:hypothetical protein
MLCTPCCFHPTTSLKCPPSSFPIVTHCHIYLSQYLNLCHPQCLSELLCVVSMYLAQDYYCWNVLLQLLLFLITITKSDNNSRLKGNKSCSYGVTVNYWQATWHLRSHQDIILMHSFLHLFPPIWYCCHCFLLWTGIWVGSTAALPRGFQQWRISVQLKNMLGHKLYLTAWPVKKFLHISGKI